MEKQHSQNKGGELYINGFLKSIDQWCTNSGDPSTVPINYHNDGGMEIWSYVWNMVGFSQGQVGVCYITKNKLCGHF